MKKLLMLGTSYGSCDMILTAKKKGYYTIVTDHNEPKKSKAKLLADECWMISTSDVDALEKKCREEKVDGIVCGVSEFNLEVTMELSKRLGLQCYCTPEAWHYSRNKYDFKQLCKRIGVRMAEDYCVSNPPKAEELQKIKYPVVVKAINLSCNRGMSYCNNEEELIQACEYARNVSKCETIIVERKLNGPQLSAVYVMADGEVSLLSFCSMNHQSGELRNCYSITTTESKYLNRFLREENDDIIRMLKAVGCKEGFAWVELILDEDNTFYLLEMGYRLAGDEVQGPLRGVANFDVYEWIIDYALGVKHKKEDLPAMQSAYYDKCGCIYMLWSNQANKIGRIEGIQEVIKDRDGISWDTLLEEGDSVPKHMPIGEFLFVADNVNEMCDVIAMINDKVSIKNVNGEEMIIHYTDYEHLINSSRLFAED